MKNLFILLITLISLGALHAQTNDTDPSFYSWKGKKTEMHKGYVVLKSGKKLTGEISLKGSSNRVTEVSFIGDGKEVDFPVSALQSYGLTGVSNAPLNTENTMVNENNDEIFEWRDMGIVMGKKIESTKPRSGYVITQSNQRLEGELQLKKTDGVLTDIKLNTAKGKEKFAPGEIASYGLSMTIADITKNGEKEFKDEARNFQSGSVFLSNGTSESGLVAFIKRDYINPNRPSKGYKYNGLFFAASEDAYVKTFTDDEISYVTQITSGEEQKYSPYDGGFVSESTLDELSFANKFKELNEGTITLADGSVLKGQISMQTEASANYKNDNGVITLYNADEINRFDVTIDGEKKAMVSVEGKLTEEYFIGKTFWVYVNPNPTNVNQVKTDLANSAAGFTTSAISSAIITKDAKKNGYTTNLDSLIMNSSAERLREVQNAFLAIQGYKSSEELQERSNNDTAKKYDTALSIAIAGKESNAVVYFKEIILINKSTGEEYLLFKKKKDLNTNLEGLLMGCYTFLSLEKNEQKPYYDLDNIVETAKMLDECY